MALLNKTSGRSHEYIIAGAILPADGFADSPMEGTKAAMTWNTYRRMAKRVLRISLDRLSLRAVAVSSRM